MKLRKKKERRKGRITSLNKSTAVKVKQRQVNSEHLQSSIDLIQCMLSISFWSSTKDPEKKPKRRSQCSLGSSTSLMFKRFLGLRCVR